ncbi:MAG: holliday junction DNA helicase RuvB [Hyphomonadaceae bacterium]|nr:MAG: holliday junction DNA helicase RuvB [Hyphomonadaceae bacterium]
MSDIDDERLISSDARTGEGQDRALRPSGFAEFIGQKDLTANLEVFVNAAKARQDALDHLLFHGPPGLGKTTLAQIVARELGVGFKSTSGPVIAKAGDLAALLTNLEPNDVLFIDEIHRLPAIVEEILYPAMEDYALDLVIGEGPSARSIRIDLSPFTLIGATTRSGLLSSPLRDRFGIVSRLNFYTPSELVVILRRAAIKLGVELTDDGAQEIATRARGTPRIAIRLLRRVRDFAESMGSVLDANIAATGLARLDIDPDGLDMLDRRYLRAIVETYGGGPVGVETLAAALSESRDGVEDVIEPYLLQQGFIQRTPRGRMAAARAYQLFGLPEPKVQNADLFEKGSGK